MDKKSAQKKMEILHLQLHDTRATPRPLSSVLFLANIYYSHRETTQENIRNVGQVKYSFLVKLVMYFNFINIMNADLFHVTQYFYTVVLLFLLKYLNTSSATDYVSNYQEFYN